jgi:hypothetical protein
MVGTRVTVERRSEYISFVIWIILLATKAASGASEKGGFPSDYTVQRFDTNKMKENEY